MGGLPDDATLHPLQRIDETGRFALGDGPLGDLVDGWLRGRVTILRASILTEALVSGALARCTLFRRQRGAATVITSHGRFLPWSGVPAGAPISSLWTKP